MIARLEGGGWTLIRQMDHATHCGELAQAWSDGPFRSSRVGASLQYAAAYHDLGWTEVDRRPDLDGDAHPRNFTGIDEARHTEFYSGAVRSIARVDPLASYLVSLHASGLYSRRYGWLGLKPVDWTAIGAHGRALLNRERRFRSELFGAIDPDQLEFEALWRSYMLLETFDYLSLLTCFGFESSGCGPVPTLEGQWEQLTIRRRGPWSVELDPFPFAGDVLELSVTAVHLGRELFDSVEQLHADFEAADPSSRKTYYCRPTA